MEEEEHVEKKVIERAVTGTVDRELTTVIKKKKMKVMLFSNQMTFLICTVNNFQHKKREKKCNVFDSMCVADLLS